MKGAFFGREQLTDGMVGVDYDDDYIQRPGKLVVVYCEMEDETIPDTDNSYPVHLGGPYDTPAFKARERAIENAWKHATCPDCGRERLVVPQDPDCFEARTGGYPPMVLRCPTAVAWRGEAARESGRLYRYRPTEIVPID
jgi:hypothetical protein